MRLAAVGCFAFLLLAGIYVSGILNPNGIICTEATYGTYPDFDVISGEGKLESLIAEKYNPANFDCSVIWTDDFYGTFNRTGRSEANLYFLSVEFNGKRSQTGDFGKFNPNLTVRNSFVVHEFIVAVYVILLIGCFILMLSAFRKKSIHESKQIDS